MASLAITDKFTWRVNSRIAGGPITSKHGSTEWVYHDSFIMLYQTRIIQYIICDSYK